MTRHEQKLRRLTPIAAALVALIGALVLVGWALNVEFLKSLLHPQRTAMNPATALSFIACAVALWMFRDEPTPTVRRRAAQACAATVTSIAVSRFLGYALGWQSGIDQLFFAARLDRNVMAPNTAATFFLLGLTLFVFDEDTRRGVHPAQLLLFVAGGAALFSLADYLYSSASLTARRAVDPQQTSTFAAGGVAQCSPPGSLSSSASVPGARGVSPLARTTAGALELLRSGMLAARPTREPVRSLVSGPLGGTMARRL